MSTLARQTHLLGHVGHGATLDTHTMHELPTAVQSQTGITVVHEDLLVQ